jgi:hypothetical protein
MNLIQVHQLYEQNIEQHHRQFAWMELENLCCRTTTSHNWLLSTRTTDVYSFDQELLELLEPLLAPQLVQQLVPQQGR